MTRLQIDSLGAFFSPLQEGDETPEFLRWAIGYGCGPRDAYEGDDLDLLFRQLRPLAAAGLAIAEGRVVGGACIAHSCDESRYQFDLIEVLSFYGAAGPEEVPCRRCPLQEEMSPFPQCLGWVTLEGVRETLLEAIEAAASELGDGAACLPATTPRWYGLWAESPLTGKRLAAAAAILEAALKRLPSPASSLEELIRAMRRAEAQNLPIYAALTPPGVIRGGRWLLPGHCGYCGVVRAPRQRVCKVCRRMDRWRSGEKRRIIGIRPYRRSGGEGAI
jgi:hypothetical protein